MLLNSGLLRFVRVVCCRSGHKIVSVKNETQHLSFSSSSSVLQFSSSEKRSNTALAQICCESADKLSDSLEGLSLIAQSRTPQEYSLPTVVRNNYTKLIKDPILDDRLRVLPKYNGLLIDLFAPTIGYIVPVTEPPTNTAAIRKECRRLSMIRIRYKKMKKHQLRKLRKRMRFLKAKQKAAKLKKKEKLMQEYERSQAKLGEEFNAEKSIEEHMKLGREAGWGIDILAERAAKRSSSSSSPTSSSSSTK